MAFNGLDSSALNYSSMSYAAEFAGFANAAASTTNARAAAREVARPRRSCRGVPKPGASVEARSAERLAERTRIAQELHDTLLQGFLAVSMQLHVAVDHLPADSAAKERLAKALEAMDRVLEEG